MEYHELLSTEETNALLACAQAGDSSAVDSLVRHNQRLVMLIASRYYSSGFGGDQELEDIVQWGNIGLMRAVIKWDGARGLRFSTYAVHWINGVIRRHASMRGTPLGMTHREMLRLGAIRRARSDLTRCISDPNPEVIAEQTGLSVRYVAEWLPALDFPVRLETPNTDSDDVQDFMFNQIRLEEPAPDDAVEMGETIAEVCEKISHLPEKQREVITRRYLTDPPENCSRIAADLQITNQRVHQIEQEALVLLRSMLNLNSTA